MKNFRRLLIFLGAVIALLFVIVMYGLNIKPAIDTSYSNYSAPVQLQPVSETETHELDPAIPAGIKPCLPEYNKASLIATKQRKGETLYLLRIMRSDSSLEPLISLKGDKCQVLNPIINDSDVPLSSVVDKETAKDLAVQRYKKIIDEQGGKEKFEQNLSEYAKAEQGTVWMPSEYYETLQHLGVKIPANVKPTDKVPEFGATQATKEF